jgi:hypothetical protein
MTPFARQVAGNHPSCFGKGTPHSQLFTHDKGGAARGAATVTRPGRVARSLA